MGMPISIDGGRPRLMVRRKLHWSIYICEIVGFLMMIALSLLGEIIDIPHIMFGFEPTPINTTECFYESAFAVGLLSVVLLITRSLLKKIRYLEGMLAVCSCCKRIRVDEIWIPIEQYISGNTEATFSHSYCPECVSLHFGELVADPNVEGDETSAKIK
jgi:hypothetical protein